MLQFAKGESKASDLPNVLLQSAEGSITSLRKFRTRALRLRSPSLRQARDAVTRLLESSDIQIDGRRPFDIQVRDDAFYLHAFTHGIAGFREAYVNGWCDVDRIDVATHQVLRSVPALPRTTNAKHLLDEVQGRLFNRQRGKRGRQVRQHYDLGNDLFRAMLDQRMVYSCGYWRDAGTLDEAQEAKLELVCRKLGLRPGMRVLDIGCGFGSFAEFAAQRYGCSVVGTTISEQQAKLARERCAQLPVEIRLEDYREATPPDAPYDAVVSIGMFEHVGVKNYARFFQVVSEQLKPDGLFLLHTIGSNRSLNSFDPWMHQNIFPNAHLPSGEQICGAADGTFVLEDWHGFGQDYDPTLMAWWRNFDRAWPRLRASYGERFFRVWKCYLQSCAGAFRARHGQVWQIIFSKHGLPGGYASLR